MSLYLAVLFLLIMCVFKYDLGNRTHKTSDFWYYTICVILILIAGFRYRVGGDTLHYFDTYPSWPTFSEFSKIDFSLLPYQPLWYVLAALCKLISSEFYVFQLFQASIVTFSSFWFLKKHVKYKFVAAIFWYYGVYFYFTMEVMREAICVSIWLLAVDFILQKQYVKYYILAVIAFFFHLTAALLFIMPFIYNLMQKGKIRFLFCFFIFLISFSLISMYPEIFIDYLPSKMIYKVIMYYDASEYNLFVKRDFLHIIAICLMMQVCKNIYPNEMQYIPFLKLEIIILLASTMLYYISERVVNYLYIFEILVLTKSLCVLLPKYCFRFQTSCIKLLLSLIFIFMLKTYYYGKHPSKIPDTRFYNLIVPYESVFFPCSHPWRERIFYYNEEVNDN